MFGSKEHHLQTEMFVPLPIDDVFSFFGDASNLERITPAELQFSILNESPIEMKEGIHIRYQLRLFGWPIKWRSLIAVWNPPWEFVDEQLEGPYKMWIHRHSFESRSDGTLVRDHVRYRLPFGMLGNIAHPLIRLQLNTIFSFRHKAIRACLLKQIESTL
jgi:ligand-binding SRPBCC domain-containing protein